MYPLLCREGLSRRALDFTLRMWGRMLEDGSTTLWETFAGDHLDTRCHPWSGAPIDFCLRRLAGLGPLPVGARSIELKPELSLLDRISARTESPLGSVEISWQREGREVHLSGHLPEGVEGELQLPGRLEVVRGDWCSDWSETS